MHDASFLEYLLELVNQAGDAMDEFTDVIAHQSVWIAYQFDVLLQEADRCFHAVVRLDLAGNDVTGVIIHHAQNVDLSYAIDVERPFDVCHSSLGRLRSYRLLCSALGSGGRKTATCRSQV